MNALNNRIFKAAHRIARNINGYVGCYAIAFRLALAHVYEVVSMYGDGFPADYAVESFDASAMEEAGEGFASVRDMVSYLLGNGARLWSSHGMKRIYLSGKVLRSEVLGGAKAGRVYFDVNGGRWVGASVTSRFAV